MKGAKATLRPVNGALTSLPRVPSGLNDYQKGEWKVAATDLMHRSLLVPAVLPMLHNYVIALRLVRDCQKEINSLGVVIRGENGTIKTNPASTQMTKYQEICARLGAELGLSPAARSKKDFQKGGPPNDGAPPGLDI